MSHISEDNIIAGNYYDKYASNNPIARYLMDGFFASFDQLLAMTPDRNVHEIGCGEGHLSARIAATGRNVHSTDFSTAVIASAKQLNNIPNVSFEATSVYELTADKHSAPIIVCCEVLEHLEEPEKALEIISQLAQGHLIFSVPREPIWRVLNMARGKYWSDLGNTPGHLQNWSSTSFRTMISRYFDIVELRKPLPWTMVLCKTRQS